MILGSQLRAADKYDALSKIAPTVFSIRPGFPWKENYFLNAAALDKTAEAKAKLDAYQAKAAKLGADLGEKKPTVTVLRYMPGETRLYAGASFIGTVLKDSGIPRPQNQQVDPLWKGLEAVKQGRAKDVPDETWYLGLGVTAADKVLDDLRGLLVKQRRPPTPAPWPGRRAVGPWGGRHGR